jgi:hypothetical protein
MMLYCAVLVRVVPPQIGSQARLMSLALRKVTANAAKSGCTILFINQLRFKVCTLRDTAAGGDCAESPAASSYAECFRAGRSCSQHSGSLLAASSQHSEHASLGCIQTCLGSQPCCIHLSCVALASAGYTLYLL